ncbi:hypothetical protein C8Q75DRAFT_51550 [Abortiporus biennis]|nr:hypothetical protein C8Q75DRAFT_51550 [Abortiporus biennis]
MSAPATSSSPTPVVHLDNTLGAELVGALVATFLSGIGTLQTYIYFLNTGKHDSIWFRLFIAFLWVMDITLLIFATNATYTTLVTGFGDFVTLSKIKWGSSAFLIASVTVEWMIRLVFIHRVWKLCNKLYVAIFLAILNCLVFAVGLVNGIKFALIGDFLLLSEMEWICEWLFIMQVITDTLIAVAMCFLLWSMKNRVSQIRTRSQIDMLIHYSVNTGIVTSVFAIAVLITHMTMPTNLVYGGIYFTLPKVYHNAIMGLLNARSYIRSAAASKDSSEKEWNSIHIPPSTMAFKHTISDSDSTSRIEPSSASGHIQAGQACAVELGSLNEDERKSPTSPGYTTSPALVKLNWLGNKEGV